MLKKSPLLLVVGLALFASQSDLAASQSSLDPLVLAVTASPDAAIPGELVTYSFTVANRGTSAIEEVVIDSEVPELTESFLAAGTGGYCHNLLDNCYPGVPITWEIGTLKAGQSRTVLMTGRIEEGDLSPDGESLHIDAVATGRGVPNSTAHLDIEVRPGPSFSLGLVANRTSVEPGDKVTYTLSLSNRSGRDAHSVSVRLPVPTGMSFITATGGLLQGTGVEWNFNALYAGQTVSRQVSFEIGRSAHAGDLIIAHAEVIGGGPRRSGVRASAVLTVMADPQLVLSLTANPDPVGLHELVTFAITATNRTNRPLTGIRIRSVIPDYSASFISLFYGGTCYNLRFNCLSGLQITWDVKVLPAGGSVTFLMPGMIDPWEENPPYGTIIRGSAIAISDDGPSSAAFTDTFVVEPASMALTLMPSQGPAVPSGQLGYSAAVSSRSSKVLRDVVLRVPIPSGVSVAAANQGNLRDGIIEWKLGNLAPGQVLQKTFTLRMNTTLAAAETITFSAESHEENGTRGQVARATILTQVIGGTELLLSAKIASKRAKPGDPFKLIFRITNSTSRTLEDVQVQTLVPDHIESFSSLQNGGLCHNLTANCLPGTLISWSLGSLRAGESREVSITSKIEKEARRGSVIYGRVLASAGEIEAVATVGTVVQ